MAQVPKNLITNYISDSTDSSKRLNLILNNISTGSSISLAAVQTSNQTSTFPDFTGTVLCLNLAQSATNKTITDSTNNVTGSGIFSGPANNVVIVSASANPSAGQSLMATSATTAAWTTVDNTDPMTTIGDMIYRNSSNVTARLPLGSQGQFLRASGLSPPNDVVWNEFIQPMNESTFFDDFGGGGTVGLSYSWSTATSNGTVAATVAADVNNGNWIGGASLSTTGSSGRAGMTSIQTTCLGFGSVYFEAAIYLSVISVTGQTALTRIGFHNSTTNVLPTNGIYFTNATADGAWVIVTVSSSSTSSTTTAVVPSANTWYRMGILINSNATLVTYYVNGVSIGTQSSNIPASYTCGPCFTQVKTGGTNASKLVVDYCYYNLTYNSSRY